MRSYEPSRGNLSGARTILIDASPLTNTVDGLGVYIVNLVKHLPDLMPRDVRLTLLLNPEVDRSEFRALAEVENVSELRLPIAPIGPRRDLDMYRFLRDHRDAFDLIHVTSNNYPFALRGGVWTIHDVTFKRWFDRQRGIPGTAALARAYLDRMIRHGLTRADAIIAVSDATRRQVIEDFAPTAQDAAKIEVIHEGWEHLDAADTGACARFPFEEEGYVFFLGSYRVHKNLERLLRAFERSEGSIPPEKRLVISGSSGRLSEPLRALVDRINARRERVTFTGYVSDACVRRLYEHADAFIFPSLSEGFGLPVLEAFRYGAPLLASRATALPEVAGDAALYFDPESEDAMTEALVRFYGDPALAAELRRKGRARLDAFSWRRTAEQTAAIYRRHLGCGD